MREPVVVTRPAHFTVDDDVTSMGKTAASAIRAIRVVAPIVVMLANQLAILQRPRRPNAFDMKGRAKHDAWVARRGMAADEAMREYLERLDRSLPSLVKSKM